MSEGTPALKFCRRCGQEKERSSFNRDRTRGDGLQKWCRQCSTEQHRNYAIRLVAGVGTAQQANWVIAACLAGWDGPITTEDAQRARSLYYRYRLTWREYVSRLEAQDYGCAICREPVPPAGMLAVDHDHDCCPSEQSCGQCVRGLLCLNCNKAIGFFRESAKNVGRAYEYLTQAS